MDFIEATGELDRDLDREWDVLESVSVEDFDEVVEQEESDRDLDRDGVLPRRGDVDGDRDRKSD